MRYFLSQKTSSHASMYTAPQMFVLVFHLLATLDLLYVNNVNTTPMHIQVRCVWTALMLIMLCSCLLQLVLLLVHWAYVFHAPPLWVIVTHGAGQTVQKPDARFSEGRCRVQRTCRPVTLLNALPSPTHFLTRHVDMISSLCDHAEAAFALGSLNILPTPVQDHVPETLRRH